MKKSKIVLLYSFIIFFTILYVTYNFICLKETSKYRNENNFKIKVLNYKIKNNKLTIIGKGKEKLILNYYLKNNETIKIKTGIIITLKGNINNPKKNSNFYLFNYKNYLLSKKIKKTVLINEIIHIDNEISFCYKIKNSLINRINNINNKYLNLFILGENQIENNVKESYSNNGISHLFAISGMHISLFTLIMTKLLKKLIKNKTIIISIIVILLIFYMFITNYSPSIVRASLLYIGMNLKKNNLFVILNILLIMLIYNPFYLYDVGFNFSFIISIFLIIFNKIINKYNNYFYKIFLTSVISFLASIPILIINFHQINFFTIINNIIFVPFVSMIVFPFSLIVLLFPSTNIIYNFLINVMENISLKLDKINFLTFNFHHTSLIIIIIYYLIIFLIIKNKFINKYLLLFLTILFIHNNINYLNNYVEITFIDVGQGDSILIKFPKNKAVLIDTGGMLDYTNYSIGKNIVIPYLKSEGINKLDYLILTHGDLDHMKEANTIVNNIEITNVLINSGNNNKLENKLIKNINKKNIKYKNINKYKIKIGTVTLWFINKKNKKSENEDSLIVYTKINNYNILLMGDAGIQTEKYLLNEYNLKNVDILKVGHHGSKNSTCKEFINAIKPKNSIISVGIKNNFNHPDIEVINNLEKSNIYMTSISGMIKIKIKKEIKIETCL